MLLKSIKVWALCRYGAQFDLRVLRGDVHPLNGMYKMLYNSFSNMTLLNEVDESVDTESPELQSWVKFAENDAASFCTDDDFVLPSISHWVDRHKLLDQEGHKESVMRDFVDSDVDKISRVLNNPFDSVDSVMQALFRLEVNVSNGLVYQVLKRFSNNWIVAYGFFRWAQMCGGSKHSPDSYNMMIDILGKSKNFDRMWEVVEELDRFDKNVTLQTMTKVMRRLAKVCKYKDAIEAFRNMDRFEVEKDVDAFNVLIDLLMKERNIELAQDVYKEFKNQITPNISTFNILLRGWCKVGNIEKAIQILEGMEKSGVSPDVISYTSIIDAYCQEKDFRKVDEILKEMQEVNCPPNVVTYTIIMHARGRAKETNEALAISETMKKNGCAPDTAFCSSLIYILGKAGRLKDAEDVFEDMPKQKLIPDVLTYNTMITLACRHLQEEKALQLLQKMEENHCPPNSETYFPILKMCCRLKRMKMISFLLSHMLKNDVSVGLNTYLLLIRGLCNSGKLEHACSFFEEVVLKRFVPPKSSYNELVKKLEENGMVKAKTRIEELMLLAKEQQIKSCREESE